MVYLEIFAYLFIQTVFNDNLESCQKFSFSDVDHIAEKHVHPTKVVDLPPVFAFSNE